MEICLIRLVAVPHYPFVRRELVQKGKSMSLPVFKLADGRNIKLGKAPARHDPRTLQLAKYIPTGSIPAPPALDDWSKKVRNWPMMLNDSLGDCTCACAGHMIEQWTTYASTQVIPPDNSI